MAKIFVLFVVILVISYSLQSPTEKDDKAGKTDKPGKDVKGGKSHNDGKNDTGEKGEKIDKSGKVGKVEKDDKNEKQDKNEKSGRDEKCEKDETDNSDGSTGKSHTNSTGRHHSHSEIIKRRCMKQAGVDSKETRKAIKKNTIVNDPKFKCYVRCVYTYRKLMTSTGEPNADRFRQHIALYIKDKEKACEIQEKCVKISDTPCNTAFNIHKCLNEEGVTPKKRLSKTV